MKVSLTSYIDYLVAVGPKKIDTVRKIKCRDKYSPMTDHWKQFRDAICDFHDQSTWGKVPFFDQFLKSNTNPKKANSFKIAAENYKKFLGRKKIESLVAKKAEWAHGDLKLSINPELFLNIDGERTIIKLAFKSSSLSTAQMQMALALMSDSINPKSEIDTIGIYDAKANKLVKSSGKDERLMMLIRTESDAFVTIWNAVECPEPPVPVLRSI